MNNYQTDNNIIEGEIVSETTEALPLEYDERNTTRRYPNRTGGIVTKSNDLIQKTRYSLPKVQQKILLAMISKIDTKNDADYEKVYTMTFSEFSKLTGMDLGNAGYKKYMKDTIQDLASSSFWMDIKDEENDKNKLIRWVGEETEIDNKKKEIHLQFSKRIFPFLTQLKSNYTSFNVEYLLHMSSTYSMRFYEILLSYDNGNVDYGYTNGIVFQQATDEFLMSKFPQKAKKLRGYKYKVFDIQELKQQLSPAPVPNEKGDDKKSKPLAEKYSNFSDFERYVLQKVKNEINLLTDLWLEYIPVRVKGCGRTYQRIYLFIKYKTDKEMQDVRKRLREQEVSDEIPRKSRKTKKGEAEAGVNKAAFLFDDAVFSLSVTKALRLLETKSEFSEIQKMISDSGLRDAVSGALTYTARLLTNTSPKKIQIAHDTRDALNRILDKDKTLKYWAVGMGAMIKQKNEAGLLKSPQYNATVVFNAIEDYQLLDSGKQILKRNEDGHPDMFNQQWTAQFDDA